MRNVLVIAGLLAAIPTHAAPVPRTLVLREKAHWAATDVLLQRLQFSPDGTLLVSASGGGEADTWTLEGERRGTFSGQRPPMFNAVFTPEGASLATTGYDGTVRIWPLPPGDSFSTLRLHLAAVNDVAFCGADDRLVSGSDEGVARLWNTHASEPVIIAEVRGVGTVRRVACNYTAGVFANTFDSGRVQVTTFAGRKVANWDTQEQRLNAIAISGDGTRLLTGSTDGTVKLWTIAGNLLLTLRVQVSGWVNDARFSSDGHRILVATDDGQVRIYDRTGALLAEQAVTKVRATTAAFSPDSSLVAVGTSTGQVVVYEVAH